jgi:hypothetical protein
VISHAVAGRDAQLIGGVAATILTAAGPRVPLGGPVS